MLLMLEKHTGCHGHTGCHAHTGCHTHTGYHAHTGCYAPHKLPRPTRIPCPTQDAMPTQVATPTQLPYPTQDVTPTRHLHEPWESDLPSACLHDIYLVTEPYPSPRIFFFKSNTVLNNSTHTHIQNKHQALSPLTSLPPAPPRLLPTNLSCSVLCISGCDPLRLTRAVCVTTGLELSVGPWCAQQWVHR